MQSEHDDIKEIGPEKDSQHSLCTSGLTEHYINVGSPFQGGEDFRKCYLATDLDRLRTEALGLVELVFSGSEEDRLQAAQRFREEYGNE